MPTITCRHVRSNGARCGSPALTDRALCYHHIKVARHHRHLGPSHDEEPTIIHPISASDRTQRDPILAEYFATPATPLALDLPPLEDRESIQIALSMIITAMAQNRIDPKLATAMLYGLQVASSNASHLSHDSPQNVVRDIVIEDGQQLAPDEDPVDPAADTTLSRLLKTLQQAAAEPEPELEPVSSPQP